MRKPPSPSQLRSRFGRLGRLLTLFVVGSGLAWAPLAQGAEETGEEPAQSCFEGPQAIGRVCIRLDHYNEDVCRAIALYAEHWRLPPGFFARLIWQESRFNPNAVSPVGAQGIAQFMPGTARLRKLGNSFDPAEALARSAEYLRFLERKFGNLGLAAAAYNAGEGALSRITSTGGFIPGETRHYVRVITGQSIDQWLEDEPPQQVSYDLQADKDFHEACLDLARNNMVDRLQDGPDQPDGPPALPWGVQLAEHFSPDIAANIFNRLKGEYASLIGGEQPMLVAVRNPNFGGKTRYAATVGRPSREEADALCRQLKAGGGSCVVIRN